MKTDKEIRELCKRYDFIWATRRVADGGFCVSRMLRRKPNPLLPSSGWFFLSQEDELGVESAEDIQLCTLERVLKHSPMVADYLHLPSGSLLQANSEGMFTLVKKGRAWWEFWRNEEEV